MRPDPRVRPGSRARTVASALVAIAVLTAGCGGDDEGARTAGSTTGAAADSVGATATQIESQRTGAASGGSDDGAAGADDGAASDGSDEDAPSADEGAASGGSDDGAAGADQGAPTVAAAIKAVLTEAASPEQACGTYVTERFLQRAYGGRANCVAARRPNALADSIRITRSFMNEQGAHAVAIPSGGPYDGAKVQIEVIPATGSGGGPYKVDSLKAHVPAGP